MNKDIPKSKHVVLETKEYRRFAEFCDSCRQNRYIGLCHGFPGVGKTFSAWRYANWHLIQPYFPERFYLAFRLMSMRLHIQRTLTDVIAANGMPFPSELGKCRGIIYTPSVTNTPKRLEQEIEAVRLALSVLVDAVRFGMPEKSTEDMASRRVVPDPTGLIIIDEADRPQSKSETYTIMEM